MSSSPAAVSTSATPILYRVKKLQVQQKKSNNNGVVWGLAAVIAPATIIFLMIGSPAFLALSERITIPASRFIDLLLETYSLPVVLAIVPALFVLVIFAHETGHLLAGLSVGFRLLHVRFGSFVITPPFRVQFRKHRSGAAAAVAMVPVSQNDLIVKAVVFVAAGPSVNLLCGLLLRYRGTGESIITLFAVFSLLIGALNLIPFGGKGFLSDGKRLVTFLIDKGRGERYLSILTLLAELKSGTDPDCLSPEFLRKAIAVQDESPDTTTAHVLAYSAASLQNRLEEAERLLEVCLEYARFSGAEMVEALQSDAAVFLARKRKRVDLAEQWRADLPDKPMRPSFKLRVDAAILEAKGDLAGAMQKLEEIEKEYLSLKDDSSRRLSLKSLQRWRSELQQPA